MRITGRLMLVLPAVLLLALTAGPVVADWDITQPAKWEQLPDLNTTGLDVNASGLKILGDDFKCRQTGPITDIHIWGSWLEDVLPKPAAGGPGNENNVAFTVLIFDDIPDPDGPDGEGYSQPGELKWWRVFQPGEFVASLYEQVPNGEGWYNPGPNPFSVFPADYKVWQYNFFIDEAEAFIQQGTPEQPVTYWLGVAATPTDPDAWFGWKSSLDHWNDDAVWSEVYLDPTSPVTGPDGNKYSAGDWLDLHYPDGHPFYPDSIDLAFVITPEPTTLLILALSGLGMLRRRK